MTRDEAKLHLQACSLDPAASTSPEFEEALALVERDPELAAWWEKEQEFDDQFALQIERTPVPLDLRTQILRENPPRDPSRKSVAIQVLTHILSPNSLRTLGSFCAAFAVVVFISVMLFEPREATALDELPGFVSAIQKEMEDNQYPAKDDSSDEAFFAYLKKNNAPAPSAYLDSIKNFDKTGASYIEDENSRIGILYLQSSTGENFRLFVMRHNLKDSATPIYPETALREYPQFTILTWRDSGKVHALVSQAPAQSLQALR